MIAIAIYLIGLLATLPARLFAPAGVDAAGTVWHGQAAAGGHLAAWDWSLARSLAGIGVAADWTVDGAGTQLAGVARWRPGGTELGDVRGRAGWPLVAQLAPDLPFACDIALAVDLDSVAERRIVGTVTSEPGTCTGRIPGATRTLPRLIAVGEAGGGAITPWANRADRLADWSFPGERLRLRITAAGARLLPGGIGPSEIEVEL